MKGGGARGSVLVCWVLFVSEGGGGEEREVMALRESVCGWRHTHSAPSRTECITDDDHTALSSHHEGLRYRVQGLGPRVKGLGSRAQGLGSRV
eukprot:3801560-Rhodomonas_salina.1